MLSNEWILNNKISGIKLVFSLYATYTVFAVFAGIVQWFHVGWRLTKMLIVEVRGDITSKVCHRLERTGGSEVKDYRHVAAGAVDSSPLVQGNLPSVVVSLRVVGMQKILAEDLRDIKWAAYSVPAIPTFWSQNVQ